MTNQPRKGEFYILMPDLAPAPRPGAIFENEQLLLTPPRLMIKPARGGFPPLKETPRLVLDPAKGPAPRDLEAGFSGYWLMSERLKNAIAAVDPDGFTFVECDVRNIDGSQGPSYFLADGNRVLDALDEANSTANIEVSDEFVDGKYYDFGGGASLAFRKDVIGQAHVFHLPYSSRGFVVCDQVFRQAAMDAGATDGLWFTDTADWSDA